MKDPLRILLTNIDMRFLTGTVVVTRDFALKLKQRGHTVVVYSPRLGKAATDLRLQGVTVVDHLDERLRRPDIIHGHHNLPALMALARFVDVPAIWINHGRADWFDSPPIRQIAHYFAVDAIRRDLLTKVYGIAPSKVELLGNAVDLNRFTPRSSPLPGVPTSLLLFAKTRGVLPTVVVAANICGLKVDSIGVGVQRTTATPERFLRKADIVIATGRMAIEALCVGAAVVVGDRRGIAGMVTSKNYDALRTVNFGATSLIRPLNTITLETEIRRYDADDAAKVSTRMRGDADLEKSIDRLEQSYRDAMASGYRTRWTQEDAAQTRTFLDTWPAAIDPDPTWQSTRIELAALVEKNAELP